MEMFQRFPHFLKNFFAPQLPPVACEISDRCFVLARMNPGNLHELERYILAPLPDQLVTPSLTIPMISSEEIFLEILKKAFAQTDIKTSRISVALPDQTARISVQILDSFIGNAMEKTELLKWKLKKTLPFNIEETRLSYWERQSTDGKILVLTVCSFQPVVSQVEALFEKIGLRAGLVTLSSLAALELFIKLEPGQLNQTTILVTLRPDNISVFILEKGSVVLFRQNQLARPAVRAGDDVTHLLSMRDLYDELHPCLMYYQDKSGLDNVDRIWVASSFHLSADFSSELAGKAGCPVSILDPLKLVHSRGNHNLSFDKYPLIPSLGLAMGKF
jgi:Tfp pilus assembly PilM family ATPase